MDKSYWNKYYMSHAGDRGILQPSSFATFCQQEIFNKSLKIIELGCGNGRDAIFFALHGHTIHALDQSTVAIEFEKTKLADDDINNLYPRASDFVLFDYNEIGQVDVFYSRFSMHAITLQEEIRIISTVYDQLSSNGLFCIEARTTRDSLFGVGEHVCDTTYKTDHARRFIDPNKFIASLLNLGFSLKYFYESNGLSVYKDDDPVLMRAIVAKD